MREAEDSALRFTSEIPKPNGSVQGAQRTHADEFYEVYNVP